MSESLWDRVRRALRREASDIEHAIADATQRGHEVLDEKERELAATPEERLLTEQQRSDQANEEFEALKRKIEGEAD